MGSRCNTDQELGGCQQVDEHAGVLVVRPETPRDLECDVEGVSAQRRRVHLRLGRLRRLKQGTPSVAALQQETGSAEASAALVQLTCMTTVHSEADATGTCTNDLH